MLQALDTCSQGQSYAHQMHKPSMLPSLYLFVNIYRVHYQCCNEVFDAGLPIIIILIVRAAPSFQVHVVRHWAHAG